MRMCIDEARQDGAPIEVNAFGFGTCQAFNVEIAADSQKLTIANGHGLRESEMRVNGDDLGVDEYAIRIAQSGANFPQLLFRGSSTCRGHVCLQWHHSSKAEAKSDRKSTRLNS